MRKIFKIGAAFVNAVIIFLLAAVLYLNKNLPDNYYVVSGGALRLNSFVEAVPCAGGSEAVEASTSLDSRVDLKLLGIIPIKTVSVQEIDTPLVVPSGAPFGIKLLTDGVIVVEVSSFETDSGFKCPAKECGIRAGDIIKSIDGKTVNSNSEVEKIISSSGGKSLNFNVERDENSFSLKLTPVKCSADGEYRAGLWVRDSSAGIGTMTFYRPTDGAFAGLGHPVCDVDTGKIFPLSSGEVVKVSINGVKKGISGSPGELMGGFLSSSAVGSLKLNSESGLYGVLDNYNENATAIPLGLRQNIKTGKAYIYTTINGMTPEKYEITIEKIDLADSEESRNMIIRVTDEDLLRETGGIVQGMSGSPIIQDGKLVGAVTHVFVNNPTKGYAIFADSMYEQLLEMTE
ncbi:MAG: SpoIVB peptidase [Oscillospiraceae bacterium]